VKVQDRGLIAERQRRKVGVERQFVKHDSVVFAHHLGEDLVVLVPHDAPLVDLFHDRVALGGYVGVDHVPHQVKVDGLPGGEVEVDAANLQALAGHLLRVARHPVAVVFGSGANELRDVGVRPVSFQLIGHIAEKAAQGHFVLVAGSGQVDDRV